MTDLNSMLNDPQLHGSFQYFWNDGWVISLSFYSIFYFSFVGIMIKIVLQYFLFKFIHLKLNYSLCLFSAIITIWLFFLILSIPTSKPVCVYIIFPLITATSAAISELLIYKGYKNFGWIRESLINIFCNS